MVWRPGLRLPAAIRRRRRATPSLCLGMTSPTMGTSLRPTLSLRCRGNGPTPTAPTTLMPMGFHGRILCPAASQTTKFSRISSQQCWDWRKPLQRMPARQIKPVTRPA
uniref:Uncharacterized protein n=1 Tax=Triticum urartu TaxID=4572 RepID=A0A8R7PY16_TRIUA